MSKELACPRQCEKKNIHEKNRGTFFAPKRKVFWGHVFLFMLVVGRLGGRISLSNSKERLWIVSCCCGWRDYGAF